MTTLTVSSKFQIVIPARMRKSLGLRAGQKLHAIEYCGRIQLVRLQSMKAARGFLKGLDTEVHRDADRVFYRS